MNRQVIVTQRAPGAIGPYSQGIAAGNMVFTSGQLPLNMRTGELETTDIAAATRYALENVRAILETAGASMSDVVKTTVFLTDLADFSIVNDAYADFFEGEPPARSCIQVAALPKGVHIEVEAIAVKA